MCQSHNNPIVITIITTRTGIEDKPIDFLNYFQPCWELYKTLMLETNHIM